jgi:hypothetical protein
MRCQVIVSMFNNKVCDEHEFDWLEPICVVPPEETNEVRVNT